MRFKGRGFRAHDPKWSFAPLSGAGAAATGGRFNRKGRAALYLSLDVVTAVGECSQGFAGRLPPLLICEYDIDVDPIADLSTDASRAALGVDWIDIACGWMSEMRAGRDVPSWLVADALERDGFAGLLVRSMVPGALDDQLNLVLWRWGDEAPVKVRVFDPGGRLPIDQASWRRGSDA